MKKAFDFLYHIPGERRIVDTHNAQKSNNGYTTEVDPDFGQGQIRAMQQLLVKKTERRTRNRYIRKWLCAYRCCKHRTMLLKVQYISHKYV